MSDSFILPQIILVEDSDEDASTVFEAFENAGFTAFLQRVSTGDECMAILRQPDATAPALVIMDLNTPGMDGREALRLIKADAGLKVIPVVVVSTSANPRDLDFCYSAGANAYQIKPMRYPDHLLAMKVLFEYWLGGVTLPENTP